jgi:tetratricopeptide (TPR) repeat protein
VKYLLEGSAQKSSDHVRIGVELVDAASGTQIWTQRFDRPPKNIFAVQDEIVEKVLTTLGLILKQNELKTPHSSFRPTDNLEAYDDFLRGGEYFWRFTKDDNAKARQWYREAIKLDPECGGAYAIMGWSYWLDAWSQWSENPKADLSRASELAHKALALDDSNSSALGVLSYVDWMQQRFDQAVADAERAVALNPNSASAYQALFDARLNAVEPEEALRAAEKAMRLDPAAADFYAYGAGLAYYLMGRYQEAVTLLKRNIAASPNNLVAHLYLLVSYAELGRDQDARAEAAEVLRISPGYTVASSHRIKTDAANKMFERDLRKAGMK